MPRLCVQTPTGPFEITEEDGQITGSTWGDSRVSDNTPLLSDAAEQIAAYFNGKLTEFDLPLKVDASEFQQRVCAQIAAIPFGETKTYGEIAKSLGAPPQAIGRGCGGNPIPLFVPCHRVLATNGLGGFSGGTGLETKIWLLRHERAGGLLI